MSADNTAEEQRGRPFLPGQSGNPKGRPKGARSKVLVMLDALAEGEVHAIAEAMIEKAKGGDAVAAKAILDRVWPARKGARVEFDLPSIDKAEELPEAVAAVGRQMAEGLISPDEAAAIVGILESQRKAIETSDIAARLAALEGRMDQK